MSLKINKMVLKFQKQYQSTDVHRCLQIPIEKSHSLEDVPYIESFSFPTKGPIISINFTALVHLAHAQVTVVRGKSLMKILVATFCKNIEMKKMRNGFDSRL